METSDQMFYKFQEDSFLSMAKLLLLIAALFLAAGQPAAAQNRDDVLMVGSSTVFPFAARVSKTFTSKTEWKTTLYPTGTGGGFSRFCDGYGAQHPDVTGASRRISKSEYQACQEKGINSITEINFGKDGIVFANSTKADSVSFTRQHLYLALAKDVLIGGQFVSNPHTNWRDIDSRLPDMPIRVYGPPATSGTRDAFESIVISGVCSQLPEAQALSSDQRKTICSTLREDESFKTMDENDTLILREVMADRQAFGIFGFSYAYNNDGEIQVNAVDGVRPNFETIADGSYPLSRPLYIYVKNQHLPIVPGLKAFVQEFVSADAIDDTGYLTDLGLIPLSSGELIFVRGAAEVFTPMTPMN